MLILWAMFAEQHMLEAPHDWHPHRKQFEKVIQDGERVLRSGHFYRKQLICYYVLLNIQTNIYRLLY